MSSRKIRGTGVLAKHIGKVGPAANKGIAGGVVVFLLLFAACMTGVAAYRVWNWFF